MEWVLQVVDEMDDAIGAARLHWMGLNAEIGALLGGGAVIAALGATLAVGREAVVICSAAVILSIGAGISLRGRQRAVGLKST
jgi:hypothetical protein